MKIKTTVEYHFMPVRMAIIKRIYKQQMLERGWRPLALCDGLASQLCLILATPWSQQSPLSMEFPSKNNGVGCHLLLQGIFPTKRSNHDLLHCRHILYQLSHQGSHVN